MDHRRWIRYIPSDAIASSITHVDGIHDRIACSLGKSTRLSSGDAALFPGSSGDRMLSPAASGTEGDVDGVDKSLQGLPALKLPPSTAMDACIAPMIEDSSTIGRNDMQKADADACASGGASAGASADASSGSRRSDLDSESIETKCDRGDPLTLGDRIGLGMRYYRLYLAPYARSDQADFIRRLAGAAAHADDLSSSPYADLVSMSFTEAIARDVMAVWRRSEGMPAESVLETVLRAGRLAERQLKEAAAAAGCSAGAAPSTLVAGIDPRVGHEVGVDVPPSLRGAIAAGDVTIDLALPSDLVCGSTVICPVSRVACT